MTRPRPLLLASLLLATAAPAFANPGAQLCSIGTAAVGQAGSVICKNVLTGATTQSIPVGDTVAASGGVGGNLSRHGNAVLVTNLAAGAILFQEIAGWLKWPVTLQTGGEGSLSGALGDQGAYVLTATRILFFRPGHTQPSSTQSLLVGDGSAAQVALAGGYAYVSEKSGSLEAFALGRDGSLDSRGVAVAGIPAGVIVGLTGAGDLLVSPVAHLATNAGQATIAVAGGVTLAQHVLTKEVAACWTANDAGEVCVSNPGSQTVSCGQFGPAGFTSYTGAAASPGESLFDIDVRGDLVGIQAVHNGVQVVLAFSRSAATGDFLTLVSETPLGTATATGALLLPPAL